MSVSKGRATTSNTPKPTYALKEEMGRLKKFEYECPVGKRLTLHPKNVEKFNIFLICRNGI